MTNSAHIIETALLLLVAYLIGCLIGYWLRRLTARQSRSLPPPLVAAADAASPPSAAPGATPMGATDPAAAAIVDATVTSALPAAPPATAAATKPAQTKAKTPKSAVAKTASTKQPEVAPIAAKSKKASAIKPLPTPAEPMDPKPVGLSAPRGGAKDDLKSIRGIGPKIEIALNGLGVFHFDQLATLSKSNIDWIDTELGFKGRVEREDWIGQARTLAKADEAEPKA